MMLFKLAPLLALSLILSACGAQGQAGQSAGQVAAAARHASGLVFAGFDAALTAVELTDQSGGIKPSRPHAVAAIVRGASHALVLTDDAFRIGDGAGQIRALDALRDSLTDLGAAIGRNPTPALIAIATLSAVIAAHGSAAAPAPDDPIHAAQVASVTAHAERVAAMLEAK